jgi:hypothetical protein
MTRDPFLKGFCVDLFQLRPEGVRKQLAHRLLINTVYKCSESKASNKSHSLITKVCHSLELLVK